MALIDRLNAKDVKYNIIGDYQHLPESVGHDVDLWTNDMKAFRSCLESAMKETGFLPILDNETHQGFNIACYKRIGYSICIMKFDVMHDTSFKSFLELVSSEEMEACTKPYKNFFIAGPESEALMHFLYPMFEWGFIKKDVYKEDILRYYKEPLFFNKFVKLWGKTAASQIIYLIEKKEWGTISKMMPALKRKAVLKAVVKPHTWLKIWHTGVDLIGRWFKPTGQALAFCGLDGAGKTTILDELNDIFVDLLKSKKVFYGYWRPFCLPEMRVLLGKKVVKDPTQKEREKGKTIIEPGRKPKGKLTSLVKLFYFWMDYMLAFFKYGQIQSRGGMVLFDRHYIDMIVHPQRFEMNVGRGLMLFLYKFIPKPDFTFFLWCTPDEILLRKQEFSREEISKMIDDYNNVGQHIKNFTPIHTNTTIEEEVAEIFGYIASKCEKQ